MRVNRIPPLVHERPLNSDHVDGQQMRAQLNVNVTPLRARRRSSASSFRGSSTLTVHYRPSSAAWSAPRAGAALAREKDGMANTISKSELIQRIVEGHP